MSDSPTYKPLDPLGTLSRCEECGSTVFWADEALHTRWHSRIDGIERDAFRGGGVIG